MSSDDHRRQAREARDAARREAKEAGAAARRKAKEAGAAAREQALEAADEAKAVALRAAVGTRGDDPFGLLWSDAAPARRGRGRGSGLNREDIVAVALKVAEAEGPEAVSMRRIATELGVGTMSLYHHIPTKDDLLDLMQDSVMGELVIPAGELAGDWREALAQISRRTRAVYERHHWMVSGAWERPQLGPRAFAHVEQSFAVMAGIPAPKMMRMLGAADDYVIGFVSRQVATRAALRRADMDLATYQEALKPHVERLLANHADEFPHLAGAIDGAWDDDEDERFEQGLRWLLAGMAADLRSGA
jgi:AcrR family transcriptional regulator